MAIALADIWQDPMHHDYQVFAEDVAGAILKAKNDAIEEALRLVAHERRRMKALGDPVSVHVLDSLDGVEEAIRNMRSGAYKWERCRITRACL